MEILQEISMADRQGVVIVGELSDGKLASITAEVLNTGRRLADDLGQELAALFIGSGIGETAREAIQYGADKVYVIEGPVFADYLNDSYVAVLENFDKLVQPEVLLLGHTALSRDLAPRLAFRLGTGLTFDCTALAIDPETRLLHKTKPVYGGNALAVYVCEEGRPQMATIRPKTVDPAGRNPSRKGEVISFVPDLDKAAIRGKVTGRKREETVGIRLEEANVVVCGGRGIGGQEQFRQLDELARLFSGAVGATRPPCDAKWCPANYQIGLTGKLVSPALFIGIALSGASQHISGMSGSKAIVAINKDPEANIFGVAHYGVVGDYAKVLPAFIEKCKELLNKG
jgi:electron transfer flavoprotein alpha subunit